MQQIYYAALVLLLVVLVMSLPMKILAPIVIVGAILYIYYDTKKQSLNKRLIKAFRNAANKVDATNRDYFLKIADIRSRDKYIESVLVGKDSDMLIPDAIKKELPAGFNDEDLENYLVANSERIAHGETYEELEVLILKIKDSLNSK